MYTCTYVFMLAIGILLLYNIIKDNFNVAMLNSIKPAAVKYLRSFRCLVLCSIS